MKKVKSNNLFDLIIEGAENNSQFVIVHFKKAFNKKEHSNLSTELIKLLKKEKIETFSILTEYNEIFKLKKSNDVKYIYWIK